MNKTKLVSFDLDDTLIYDIHSVLFPCLVKGNYLEARQIDKKEDQGLIDWIDADYQRAKLLKGLKVEDLKENFTTILKPINHIISTITELKKKHIKCILITAEPVQVAKIAAEHWGFDDCHGSLYEEINGVFTGRIIEHIGDKGKVMYLNEYCKKYEINPDECIGIGDGSTDIPIFDYCGKSIAINYSDSIIGKATYYLKTNDLTNILPYI